MLCVIELDLGSASGLGEFVYLAPFSQVAIHVNFYFVHMKAEDHMVCGLFIHMKVEAHCGASLLGFVSDHRVVMILQVPREALEFAGMSINFRSGKFGYSICPIFSKGHAEIFREF